MNKPMITAGMVATTTAQATATAETLIGFCRERLAGYKTPKQVVLIERLPKNASGKILKRELRAQLVAHDKPGSGVG